MTSLHTAAAEAYGDHEATLSGNAITPSHDLLDVDRLYSLFGNIPSPLVSFMT